MTYANSSYLRCRGRQTAAGAEAVLRRPAAEAQVKGGQDRRLHLQPQ